MARVLSVLFFCQSLVLLSAGALGAQDGSLLLEQAILNAFAMLGQRSGWQRIEREIATLVNIIIREPTRRAATDLAAERENNLLLQWLGIDSHELANLNLQARLLAYFAAQRLINGLAWINRAPWQIPPINGAPVRQQYLFFLED